jgi:hypothetical protein
MAMKHLAIGAGCWFAAVAHAAPDGPPGPGRHPVRLCVQLLDAAGEPNCGPAEASVRPGNRLRVQVSDIVYRLELHSSQVDVVLMHGSMQIDGFTAFYDWKGSTLQFIDLDKRTRYEVRFKTAPAGVR